MVAPPSTNWKTVSYFLIGTVIMVTLVAAALYYQVNIQTHGNIDLRTVGCAVYYDSTGTTPLTAIDWGTLPPNSVVNVTMYVKNTGNTPVNYTIATSNFSPPAVATYITVTADMKNIINAAPNTIIPIIITENISPATTGITNYSYQLVLTATSSP
jgi:hypothetical protein